MPRARTARLHRAGERGGLVTAGGGKDEISARDQTSDTIDCGAGRDKVTADRTDKVRNCEGVRRTVRKG